MAAQVDGVCAFFCAVGPTDCIAHPHHLPRAGAGAGGGYNFRWQASPGVNTFPINKRLLTGVLTVTDDEVRYAMRVAFETLQVRGHPSAAAAAAAVGGS